MANQSPGGEAHSGTAAVPVTYTVTRNPAGDLQRVVRQPDGAALDIDENDQAFCDFLTCASRRSFSAWASLRAVTANR